MDVRKLWRLLKKAIFLPPIPTLLIAVPSFAFLIYVLAGGTDDPVLSMCSYILSGYALIISVTGMADMVKWIRKDLLGHPFMQRVLEIPAAERYLKETAFRAEVSLYPGLFINFLYAGIKLFSGIRYHSVWFGTLAVYYILLALMRFFLLSHIRGRKRKKKDRISELRICRMCGIVLLLLDWALAGLIILVVRKNSGFVYPGMLIYVMALYAFYAVITAVINVIKFRNHESPAISVIKVIGLTAALVSMLSLETAMLTQFGAARDELWRQRMSAATGTGVSVIVLAMAVIIIVRTTGQIRTMKREGTT